VSQHKYRSACLDAEAAAQAAGATSASDSASKSAFVSDSGLASGSEATSFSRITDSPMTNYVKRKDGCTRSEYLPGSPASQYRSNAWDESLISSK
jgi:hypothetical protein